VTMTNDDLRQHADSLRDTLNRKITELWDCTLPARRAELLQQTKALRGRIAELDEQTDNRRRKNERP
jgi:hypothetical protein